jgi:hypothetical protein
MTDTADSKGLVGDLVDTLRDPGTREHLRNVGLFFGSVLFISKVFPEILNAITDGVNYNITPPPGFY